VKKVLCILLCVVLVLSLSACTKKLPPADKTAIAEARAIVQQIRDDSKEYPIPSYSYDNETLASDLPVISIHKVYDAMKRYNATRNVEKFLEAGILPRYNYGVHYLVARVGEDTYYFARGTHEHYSTVDHFPNYPQIQLKKLTDAEWFYDTVRVGVSRKKIEAKAEDWIQLENMGVYLLDDMTHVIVRYEKEKVVVYERPISEDETVTITFEIVCDAKHDVLPYLLPQDLALIS